MTRTVIVYYSQAGLFVYSFVLINFSDVMQKIKRGKQWKYWHIHIFIFLMYCETLLIIFQIHSIFGQNLVTEVPRVMKKYKKIFRDERTCMR